MISILLLPSGEACPELVEGVGMRGSKGEKSFFSSSSP
jgi:hypothetical protein